MNLNAHEIKGLTISPEMSLKETMKYLGMAGHKVVFVVDENDMLIGSVTDGDVRRAILNGIEFDKPVSLIMFKSPRFVRSSEADYREKAKHLVLNEKIYTVPVVDDSGKIVDIYFWHDYFKEQKVETQAFERVSNNVVIMAGGKGTRLEPFTKILPKPLIPIGDKPIVERIMDNFGKYGFHNFILTLNYKKEIIKMYFKENKPPYDMEFAEEEDYLGTAGGLALLKGKVKETFFVCNCDILLENDFKSILLWHKGEKALMTVVGCHKEMVIPYGTLEVNKGFLKGINEKPTYDLIINTGVYIMEPEVLDLIKLGEKIDMNHLIERASSKGKVTVYPICDGWTDIGQWKEYRDSQNLLLQDK